MKSCSSGSQAPDERGGPPHPAARNLLLLGWARWRIVLASGLAVLRAPLKLAVIVSAWSILLLGIYALAYQGLHFIYTAAGVGPFLLDRLWYLFLFVVSIFLAVSQLASAYSTFVRSPEARWWMSLPLPASTICRAKWIESSFYSAWAVILLAAPLSLAYLVVLRRPLWLMGWMGVLLIPFIATVTALATTALLIWLRFCGRLAVRREVLAIGFVAACGILFWLLGEHHEEESQDVWFLTLQDVLPRVQVAMSPWLPSSWVAKSLSAGLNGRWVEGGLYGGLLGMTALMTWRVFDRVGAVLLVPVLQKQGQPVDRERHPVPSAAPVTMPWWMRRPFLAWLTKDLLLVIRDPIQWSQAVVFFGLLGAYFANIHRLSQISLEPSWRVGIASLNLTCTLLVFGSLSVRFIFPQMSLEGRNLWLLRIAPDGIRQLMFAKLSLYGAIAVVIIEGLLWLSASRLGIPFEIRWWLASVGVLAALTIVGLTVGLGACWIDPSAQDAARVVSSSHGAFVLVLMLSYVGCVVGALVIAWTSWAAPSPERLLLTSAGLCIISVITGWLPVRMGRAKLERLEYPL